MAGVTGPVLGMLEDVEEMTLRHAGADFLLELGQPGGLLRGRQLLQVRCSIGIAAELGVGRETGVDRGGQRRQLGLQRGGEILAPFGNAEGGAVGRQPCLAVCPGQELGAIVGKSFCADDVEVAGLQGVGQVDEHADFERAPVESAGPGPSLGDKALPALGREAEVDVVQHRVAPCVTVPTHDRQRIQQAAVLRRRLNVHQVEQPEQQHAMLGVDRPEQRQVIAAVPCGDGFALLRQGRDTALLGQELSDLTPECGVGSLRPLGVQDLAKDADQVFLDAPVLVVKSVEPLLGRGLCSPDAAQHHLDQLVAAAHARLAQEGEQQRVPSSRLGNVQQVAHLHRRSLGGELAELGVRDACQWRIPEPDRLGRRGAWRLLEAVERGRRAIGQLDQQRVQHRRGVMHEAVRHPVEDPPMDVSPKPAHQPVQGAEPRQVDGRGVQCLDRPVDQVGGVAHGFGGIEDGAAQQAFGHFPIGRDAKVGSNRGMVAIELARPTDVRGRRMRRSQAEPCCDMRNDASMDIARHRKVPEILTDLEQHRQQQTANVTACIRMHEGQVRLGQIVSMTEFLAAQPRPRTRIGGSVNGCHRVSGKGRARAAAEGVWFEGLRG